MPELSIIPIAIITVFLIVSLIFYKYRNKNVKKDIKNTLIDYKTIFIMGIIWIPVGVVLKNWGLIGFGFVLLSFSMVNKSKWNNDKDKEVKEISKLKIFISLSIGIIMLLVVYGYFKHLSNRLMTNEEVSLLKIYLENRLV